MKVYNILYLFAVILVITLSINCVSATSCTPPSGFDSCQTYSSSKGDCHATAKVYTTDLKGEMYDVGLQNGTPVMYIINEAYINIGKNSGNDLYLYSDFNSDWDNVECDENGCDGQEISSGKYVLASKGNSFIFNYAIVSYDYDEQEDCWTYAWAGDNSYTKIGTNPYDVRVVECYQNSDCGNNVCDKSGSWQNWKCVEQQSECTSGEKQYKNCQDGFSYTFANCVDNQWSPVYYQINPCLNHQNNQTNQTQCITSDCGETSLTCVGSWEVSGIKPNCDCTWKCSDNTLPSENFLTKQVFKIGTFSVPMWMLLAAIVLFVLLIIPK